MYLALYGVLWPEMILRSYCLSDRLSFKQSESYSLAYGSL